VGRGLAAPPKEPHPPSPSGLGSPFDLPWKNPPPPFWILLEL